MAHSDNTKIQLKKNPQDRTVSGKVKKVPDFKVIKDSSGCVTDMSNEYYNSKYQFSDFSKFKVIGPSIIRPSFLTLHNKGKHYKQTPEGIELAFRSLVNIYQDLDTNLTRLRSYNDAMFIRFVCKAGVFTTEAHWEMLMRNWYKGFSFAVARYYNGAHQEYKFDGVNYVAYFDMFFSNYLYYAIGRADQHLSEDCDIDLRLNEFVRLSQIDINQEGSLIKLL